MVGTEKIERFDKRDDAVKFYRASLKTAPERKYPQKLPYFTFTKLGADNIFHPEFNITEAHGSIPTEISIVFTDDRPLVSQLQMWSASQLQARTETGQE